MLAERLREVNALSASRGSSRPETAQAQANRSPDARAARRRASAHLGSWRLRFAARASSSASLSRLERWLANGPLSSDRRREVPAGVMRNGARRGSSTRGARVPGDPLRLASTRSPTRSDARARSRVRVQRCERPGADLRVAAGRADGDGRRLVTRRRPTARARSAAVRARHARGARPTHSGSARPGTLCASDPLCSEHDPRRRHSLHGASCHACLFAPETSCEIGNRSSTVPSWSPRFDSRTQRSYLAKARESAVA